MPGQVKWTPGPQTGTADTTGAAVTFSTPESSVTGALIRNTEGSSGDLLVSLNVAAADLSEATAIAVIGPGDVPFNLPMTGSDSLVLKARSGSCTYVIHRYVEIGL